MAMGDVAHVAIEVEQVSPDAFEAHVDVWANEQRWQQLLYDPGRAQVAVALADEPLADYTAGRTWLLSDMLADDHLSSAVCR